MSHACATCGYTFEHASQEMLNGCPDCGGNKFQYQPHDDAAIIDGDEVNTPVSTSEGTEAEEDAQRSARSDILEPDDEDIEYTGSASELVAGLQGQYQNIDDDDSEQPSAPDDAPTQSDEPPKERMEQLRQELNDQFESIKILEHGTYELNLERLVEREEYIIQLYEDGCYAIQMPERHMGRKKE